MATGAPPNTPPPRGTQARDALAEVLADAKEREERQRQATRPPRDTPPWIAGLAVILTASAIWLWVAPPAWLRPPPPPVVPAEVLDADLRLTVYQAVLRLEAFRDSAATYPQELQEIFEDPEDLEGLTYQRVGPLRFVLVASRDTTSVRFESDQPVEELLGDAVRVLERSTR